MSATRRIADHPIETRFLDRWSPRAFDGTALTTEQMLSLLEAARWAPSSFNAQPWRFIYALRDTAAWPTLLELLLPFNRAWAKDAGALIVIVSETVNTPPQGGDPKPSHSHSFDAGSAWAQLALQARAMDLYTHGMTGIDFAAASRVLGVPERFRVEAAIAVGRVGDPANLSEQLRAREGPSGRRPLAQTAFEGSFPAETPHVH